MTRINNKWRMMVMTWTAVLVVMEEHCLVMQRISHLHQSSSLNNKWVKIDSILIKRVKDSINSRILVYMVNTHMVQEIKLNSHNNRYSNNNKLNN